MLVALAMALGLIASWLICDASAQPRSVRPPGKAAPWTQVSRLITAQRLTEAVRLLQGVHKSALATERADDAAHAAIRLAQVRMTLSHYELAVVVLHEQLVWQRQWQARRVASTDPSAGTELPQATLALFYSQALLQYAQMYSFQVSRRERSPSPLPSEPPFQNTLRAWTRPQLLAEAQSAMAAAWEQRAALGTVAASSLPEYIEPGTVSRDEEPTLRDLLTHLYVELLLRLLHDRPASQRWLATLQVSALLNLEGAGGEETLSQAARRHPLEGVAMALGDLARWHRASGRITPSVAAQLELLSRLHAELGDANQRAQVRLQLAELLSMAGAWPIAARVHSTLAELLQREASTLPEAAAAELLERALAIAAQGARRFPGTAAGQHCRRLVQVFTAPEFHLTSQPTAAPGQPALQATYKNLTVLYFRAYADDPLARRLAGGSETPAHSGAERQALLRSGRPVAVWSAPLAATAATRLRRTPVHPPLPEPGAYVVIASARADFALANNHLETAHLASSDLVLWATTEPRALRITAVSARTGEPLPDVELSSYGRAAEHRALVLPSQAHGPALTLRERRRTGVDGSVEFPPGAANLVVFGQRGRDFAMIELGAPPEPQEFPESDEAEIAPPDRITTDRSVYHPQQKIRWRVAAAGLPDASPPSPPSPADSTPLAMTLVDADFQEAARAVVTLSRFGTASGEFALPRGRALGVWRLVFRHGTARRGESLVRVEEPPQTGLVIKLAAPESPYLGEAVMLCGSARDGAGAPVRRGQLRYEVTREPLDVSRDESAAPTPAAPETLVASGTNEVNADGRFTINFTAVAPPPSHDLGSGEGSVQPGASSTAYRFRVSVELASADGSSGVGQRRFVLGTAAVQAEILTARQFLRSEEPARLEVMRRDLEGRPQAGAASWQLLRLPPEDPGIPDEPQPLPAGGAGAAALSRLRERRDGSEHARGQLRHTADGRAELKLPGLPAGAYRLRYQSRDALGRAYQTVRELVVISGAGSGDAALGLAAWLLPERTRVRVGETARFAIGSAWSGQALWVELRRADQTVQTQLLHAGRDPMLVELPLQPADRGTLRATLTMVRDYQLVRLEECLAVAEPAAADPPTLQLTLASAGGRMRPGARQAFRLTVKNASGATPEPGTVELFAFTYDGRNEPAAARVGGAAPLDSRPAPAESASAVDFVHSMEKKTGDWPPEEPPSADAERLAARRDRLRLRLNFALPPKGRAALPGQASAAPAPPAAIRRVGSDAPGRPADADRDGTGREPAAVRAAQLAESALFLPQLPLPSDGSALIELSLPDVPGTWRLAVEARSRDAAAGSAEQVVERLPEVPSCP